MRGLETPIRRIRRQVFTKVAKLAFESTPETLIDDIEAVPYELINEDTEKYRESIYRSRAIVRERMRLAMGMSLRPEDKPVHLTAGIEESNISEKYYEPPLMQVIPSACAACEEKGYEVSDMCKGCVAHPCREVCPVGAISMKKGRSYIDQEKCIKCGKCKSVCPYDAISKKERPCAKACGVNAIGSDKMGRAHIDNDKCVSCGMCLVNCPFGAIVDKGQIFQTIHAMKTGKEVVAAIAPAFVGQFGPTVTPEKVKGALKELGFSDVVEVAIGADLCTVEEAEDFLNKVPNEQPFMATSCCPAWSVMAKKLFPDFKPYISMALTPMVLTGRLIKKQKPDAKVVFIGPCAAKKLEASRKSIRSDVDFVLTFEEVMGMFEAKGIDLAQATVDEPFNEGTANGRGFAVSGGVANAVKQCIQEKHPDMEVLIDSAEGLKNCRTMLMMAKAGKRNGYLLEGMACPGGCVAGAGTLQPVMKSSALVKKYTSDAEKKLAFESEYLDNLELISEN